MNDTLELQRELQREHLLDHYENPRHHGTLAAPDGSWADTSPVCGDRIRIEVKLGQAGARLAEAAFTGDGCVISQAAASLVLDDAIGQLVTQIEAWEPQHVLKLIGLPLTAQRVKCALLSFNVLKGALHHAQAQALQAHAIQVSPSSQS